MRLAHAAGISTFVTGERIPRDVTFRWKVDVVMILK
jgi:hypothetical protein